MITEALSVNGPAGTLEAQIDRPQSTREQWRPALLCHPHPQYGGSMVDAVLQCLAGALLDSGHAVVRFNFRGVGASDGQFDQGVGEVQDVLAMLGPLTDHPKLAVDARDAAPLLIGYSFGAAMAWQAAQQWSADGSQHLHGLWLVAPPLDMMSFPDHPSALPLGLIVGAQDDYCSGSSATSWLARQQTGDANEEPGGLHVLPGADHFFAGQQDALQRAAMRLLAPA